MSKIIYTVSKVSDGPIEKACIESWKRVYPDFEIKRVKPDTDIFKKMESAPGLFLAPDIYALKRIPDSYFEKPFIAWEPYFEANDVNYTIMFGITHKIIFDKLNNKMTCSTSDMDYGEYVIVNRKQFGGSDFKLHQTKLEDTYFIDVGLTRGKSIEDGAVIHSMIINDNADHIEVANKIDSFMNLKDNSKTKHFLVIANTSLTNDITSKLALRLVYNKATLARENKHWQIINTPGINGRQAILEYVEKKMG